MEKQNGFVENLVTKDYEQTSNQELHKEEYQDDQVTQEQNRKMFSKIGFGLVLLLVVVQVVESLLYGIMNAINPDIWNEPWSQWVLTVVGFYLTAFPLYCIYMKKIPDSPKGEPKKLGAPKFISFFFISYATVYIFNIISLLIIFVIEKIKGGSVTNPLETAVSSSGVLYTFLVACVMAPIVEEIVFRGILLNKLRRFGDYTAIWVSAIAFGLFHCNLSQFFYATALGMIFAYIAIRTNQLKYNIMLHIIVNTLGSVVFAQMYQSGNSILITLEICLLMIMLVAGIILFFRGRKNIVLEEGTQVIEKSGRKRFIYGSAGMLTYIILCIITIIIQTLV